MAIVVNKDAQRPCKCGCGNLTSGIRLYKNGEIYYAKYCHGHHKARLGISRPAWNKGLTKEICPTLSKMGFQPGHQPYNDWSKVNERFKKDPIFKENWRKAKLGNTPWNKGLNKEDYPKGIAKGEQHGNWKGNKRGIRNTAEYADFRKSIFKRDNYTCRHCGDKNRKQRGKTVILNVHHIVPISHNPSLVFDSSNATTLCEPCHFTTDTYGSKAVRKSRGE